MGEKGEIGLAQDGLSNGSASARRQRSAWQVSDTLWGILYEDNDVRLKVLSRDTELNTTSSMDL